MAINFPNGFRITSQEPIDIRLVLTKAEMKATVDARMPETYMAVCKDDGQLYIYKSTNSVDEVTGKFRIYEIDSSSLAETLPDALRQALAAQDNSASGLMVDEDGNIKVSLDSDYLSIDENNNITFADDLIISGN